MILEIENLSVDLGEFHLKNINLSIQKGEYFVLIGPTGSGKSVLLETIIGFYKESSGIIKLEDKVLNHVLPEDRGIGIVYQDNVLFPNMNVYENIAYGAEKRFSENEIKKRINIISKNMKIDHILHRNVKTLSGGEAQRTTLARALIVEPKIILMDEPFSALDVSTQTKLTALIKKIGKDYNTTFIHVTHNFNDVWNLADRVGVMKDGEIHQVGSLHDVFSKPENDFVADFVGVQNIYEGTLLELDSERAKIKLKDDNIIVSSDIDCLNKIKKNNDLLNKENERNDENKDRNILIAIRPENIIFSNEQFESSARNQLKGKIIETIESGPTVLANVDVGKCQFKGLLTKSSAEDLNIKKGEDIYISFKSLNVNIIGEYESFNKHSLK